MRNARRNEAWIVALAWMSMGGLVPAAMAQDVGVALPDDIKAETALAAPKPEERGWKAKLNLAGTGSYSHSKRVVGTEEGATTQVGVILGGNATWRSDGSEWESVLNVKEQQTRTPAIDSFIKSTDEVEVKTTYLYHLQSVAFIGPFARASLTTQLFDGYLVKPEPVTIARTRRDGTQITRVLPAEHKISLTSGLEPRVFRESAGAFLLPLTSERLTLKGKVGPGAQQIVVGDGFAVKDDAATPAIELVQLDDSNEGGAEVEIEGAGKIVTDLTWNARATMFYPVWSSVETNLSGTDALNTDLAFKVSYKLGKWASLDYVVTAKKIPLILKEWQVQNAVLFSTSFDLI